jgi:hypothetical protein
MILYFLFKKNNLLINSISIFYIVKQNSGRAFIIADSLPLQFSFKSKNKTIAGSSFVKADRWLFERYFLFVVLKFSVNTQNLQS